MVECVGFDGTTVRLKVRDDDDPSAARYVAGNVAAFESIIQRAINRPVTVRIESSRSRSSPRQDPNYDEVRQLPLVAHALELFDASIVEVKHDPGPPAAHEPTANKPPAADDDDRPADS